MRYSIKANVGVIGLILLLSACGGGGVSTDSASSGDDSKWVTPAGQYPVTTQPVTLSLLIEDDPGIPDWTTNKFTQWLEEKTGVSLEITGVPRDGKTERVNTLIASGDLPDIMISPGLSLDTIKSYGQEGLFANLTPLIDKYGSTIKDLFQQKPVVKTMISDLDGNITYCHA